MVRITGLRASPVEPPFDREGPVPVPDVAEVETLVTAVSAGTNDAKVATAAAEFLRAQTAHCCVVPQQPCARVVQPWKQAPASAVPQDPAAAAVLLQESKHR